MVLRNILLRESDSESSAFLVTACRNVTTMHLYKGTYQRQSDTGTGLMPVHLIEALEDSFHIGRRNVTAGIEDGQTVVLFRL